MLTEMRRSTALTMRLALLLLPLAPPALAQDREAAQPAAPLRIATKIAEPFVIQREDGSLEGVSIDLWRRVAADLGRDFEFDVVDLDELLDGVERGEYDAGVAAISVTAEREQRLDLTHGYFLSGLGIAVPANDAAAGWLAVLASVFTAAFLTAIGALSLLLLVVGVLVWLAERRRNPEMFGGGVVRGVGSGFWFSAVTMTTVGYGDKAPRTTIGRLLTLVWMFGSIIIISAFTGAIASALTTAQIGDAVRGPEDLDEVNVGALDASAPYLSLRDRGVPAVRYQSVAEGLQALADAELDAFVHDRPILLYTVAREYPGQVRLLEAQFDLASYAIALPQGSPLLEPINRSVLSITRSRAWEDIRLRYLGERN